MTWIDYIKKTVEEQKFAMSDDEKFTSEEYPYQLSICQIFPEENNDGSLNFNCYDDVEGLDTDTIYDMNSLSSIHFANEEDVCEVASIISSILTDEYPEISNIGVMVSYKPYDDDEDMDVESCEHSFYINKYNVWNDEELVEYLESL